MTEDPRHNSSWKSSATILFRFPTLHFHHPQPSQCQGGATRFSCFDLIIADLFLSPVPPVGKWFGE